MICLTALPAGAGVGKRRRIRSFVRPAGLRSKIGRDKVRFLVLLGQHAHPLYGAVVLLSLLGTMPLNAEELFVLNVESRAGQNPKGRRRHLGTVADSLQQRGNRKCTCVGG